MFDLCFSVDAVTVTLVCSKQLHAEVKKLKPHQLVFGGEIAGQHRQHHKPGCRNVNVEEMPEGPTLYMLAARWCIRCLAISSSSAVSHRDIKPEDLLVVCICSSLSTAVNAQDNIQFYLMLWNVKFKKALLCVNMTQLFPELHGKVKVKCWEKVIFISLWCTLCSASTKAPD